MGGDLIAANKACSQYGIRDTASAINPSKHLIALNSTSLVLLSEAHRPWGQACRDTLRFS